MFRLITFAAIIVAVPAGAVAQSNMESGANRPIDSRVTIGVTIPFGQRSNAQEHQPRLELGFDHRTNDRSLRVTGNELWRRNLSNMRIGLSLSDDPHLMLNGQAVQKAGGRYNLSTIAWVGIGIVAVAGTGALVLNDMLADASD